MNSQQLLCFITVADKLSFSKASKQLYLSIPTVSHHIKSLEFELGTTLFIRDKHNVILTSDGKALYEDAIHILKIENRLINRINDNKQTIRIVATAVSELELISSILNKIKTNYDNFRPEIVVKDYSEALYMLTHNEVDIMIGSENMIIEQKELKMTGETSLSSYLVVRKDDPLTMKEEISFKDFDNINIIRIDDRLIPFLSKNRIKDLINIHSGRVNDYIVNDEHISLSLVKAGYGVAILPEYRIPKLIDDDLTIKSIKENETYKYGLILSNYKSELVNKFVDAFTSIIDKYYFNDELKKYK